jgi:hypothetical protein
VIVDYFTHLHETGKSPATIAQAVVNIKWCANNAGINRVNNEGDRVSDVVDVIAERTLTGIRRDGVRRGRGQVNGLTWTDIERVCSLVVAVNVEDIQGGVLAIQQSKTNQEGRGEALYIGESTRRAIKRYLQESRHRIRGAVPPGSIPTASWEGTAIG